MPLTPSLYEKDDQVVFQTKNCLNKYVDPQHEHGLGDKFRES
jgi:hypothetical protein